MTWDYNTAFKRNIGWVTEWEQLELGKKRVAIAGMGGVGGIHLVTLARLGIANFHIADFDHFEVHNFNRQIGASIPTLGQAKADVMAQQAKDINPQADIVIFDQGVHDDNMDAFLDGVDLYVDGLDFFVLDVRRKIFQACRERGIPAITAAPIGLSSGYLIFTPDSMSFEDYFQFEGKDELGCYVSFLIGLVPRALHRDYLMDPGRLNIGKKEGPSTFVGCELAAAAVGASAIKLLLERGPIKAAPYFHQYDAYSNKFVVQKLSGGNASFRQRSIYKMARKHFETLLAQTPTEDDPPHTAITKVLDAARWAPSGDNNQPWAIDIKNDHSAEITITDHSAHDVYDFNGGIPSLMSAGMFFETARIKASDIGYKAEVKLLGSVGHQHTFALSLSPSDTSESPHPLAPYITIRSVDRTPYRKTPLTLDEQQELTAAVGDHFSLIWASSSQDKLSSVRINEAATDIRLKIPEAYPVHMDIIDWDHDFSQTGVPAKAIGMNPLSLRIMRWVMQSWTRVKFMNTYLAGTASAKMEMDRLPGLNCAAHFSIFATDKIAVGEKTPDSITYALEAGAAIQRFWLTAAKLGLVMQPCMAPLIFAYNARNELPFTEDRGQAIEAKALNDMMETFYDCDLDKMVFRGRIGRPKSRKILSRSIRKPLSELMKSK